MPGIQSQNRRRTDLATERARLKIDLADSARRLDTALKEAKTAGTELAASRQTVERLRENLGFVVAALPPDPRGGSVEVRAARFSVDGGQLLYDVLLYREKAAGKPMSGVLQFVVAGDSSRGSATTVTTKPMPVSVGHSTRCRPNSWNAAGSNNRSAADIRPLLLEASPIQ